MSNTEVIHQKTVLDPKKSQSNNALSDPSGEKLDVSFQKLIPYLFKMKEFWKLREEIKQKFLNSVLQDDTKSKKEEMKDYLRGLLEKINRTPKLKLILRNSLNNYKTDNNIIDSEGRKKMASLSKKWPAILQGQVDKAFDCVAEELRLLKKAQKDKNSNFTPRHISVFDTRDIMLYFGSKDVKNEKLVKFELVYFQIPTMDNLRTIFKELNTSLFAHLGTTNDTAMVIDKEKLCDVLINKDWTDETQNFNAEFKKLLKFGIPVGTRYKFYKTMVSAWVEDKQVEHERPELSDSELEMFRFILYEDSNVSHSFLIYPLISFFLKYLEDL